ncbi:hypothetical protein [Robertmurraya sp. Marseille-Q9965]
MESFVVSSFFVGSMIGIPSADKVFMVIVGGNKKGTLWGRWKNAR